MLVSKVFVRFYRSFNYDYLRKTHADSIPDPWDMTADGLFYPFVRIPLETTITTVVGGNEAGKSQLLSAIKAGLTGELIARGDFCRYSQFFAVDREMAYPDFGLLFNHLSEAESAIVAAASGLVDPEPFNHFALFRFGGMGPVAYIHQQGQWLRLVVSDVGSLNLVLPKWFDINAKIPLPDSVSIKYLATPVKAAPVRSRLQRLDISHFVEDNAPLFASAESTAAAGPAMYAAITVAGTNLSEAEQMLHLADDLLIRVAGISRSAFEELYVAVRLGNEGYANGIIERINRALAKCLNFEKFWSQDQYFALLVTLRDFDLVFTIRDRTGTEYSFSERSGGLKYFLSYFVQYLAHEPLADGTQEILLMDEPDAYLSSSGQQDLLRIFESFANPDGDQKPCQVVYVTHSPFLIDKNHGERIRVLEKGAGDEGTRVVANAARNHYEPLRSAFGSFVAETTFISNCNLMLEGMSDQVLVAGMSAQLRFQGVPSIQNIDLNSMTLVPAGSASHIPYMVYLARGRDIEQPAILVMLDSDESGDLAKKELSVGGPKRKQLLDSKYVLQLGDLSAEKVITANPSGLKTLEDLIPVAVALEAAQEYVRSYLGEDAARKVTKLSVDDIAVGTSGVHAALEDVLRGILGAKFHLDKVGLARNVVEVTGSGREPRSDALVQLSDNFRELFAALGSRQRMAMRELRQEKAGRKITRLRASFFKDFPSGSSREQGLFLFEELESVIDERKGADALVRELSRLKRKHDLDLDVSSPISNFMAFKDDLHALAYQEDRDSQAA